MREKRDDGMNAPPGTTENGTHPNKKLRRNFPCSVQTVSVFFVSCESFFYFFI
jgi:hypothetical protein